jgi:hypothetical protein
MQSILHGKTGVDGLHMEEKVVFSLALRAGASRCLILFF